MGLRVWVVEELNHAHVPVGFPFEPINKLMVEKLTQTYTLRARLGAPEPARFPV
jgi:hypothetical protein